MARAHFVKKARKDNPAAGIKAGDSYYWWKFRRGGKHYSKTAPRPSQLTQSEYLRRLMLYNSGSKTCQLMPVTCKQ